MKNLLLFFVLTGIVYLPISSFTSMQGSSNKDLPSVKVQNWFLTHQRELDQRLAAMDSALVSDEPEAVLVKKYEEARVSFKTIEFLLTFIDPQLYQSYINGAPLPKLMKKVPEQVVIQPCGFQRLDELLFEDQIDRVSVRKVLKKLRADLSTISEQWVRLQITDPVIFEAVRFGLIRATTMGITGFDRPGNTDGALVETSQFLDGTKIALSFYKPFVSDKVWSAVNELYQQATTQFTSTTFENFDRLAYQINISDPLWKATLEMQRALQIEMPSQRHRIQQPVNYQSNGLFDEGFLNANYYAQYAGHVKDDERIALGRTLFFDPILSSNNQRACASCHNPKKAFTDGLKTSKTKSGLAGLRNSPTIINSVFAERFFHDLRVDHLAAQMDHVVLNPEEFDSDYAEIVTKINGSEEYLALFKSAYGHEGITKNSVTHAVTRYVASLRSYNSDFDKYVRGEKKTLNEGVKRGFNLFSGKAACATCHFAPTFSGLVPPAYQESESEVLGVPEKFEKPYVLDKDQGRFMNRILKEQAEFYEFSFKTPTLRNVALTGPYMHNGAFATLEEVMDFYNQGGGIGLGLDVAHQTLSGEKLKLSEQEIDDIILFMKSLTDTTDMSSAPGRLPEFTNNLHLNDRTIGGSN